MPPVIMCINIVLEVSNFVVWFDALNALSLLLHPYFVGIIVAYAVVTCDTKSHSYTRYQYVHVYLYPVL